jgi:putative ABC transport system ATP-binding protein
MIIRDIPMPPPEASGATSAIRLDAVSKVYGSGASAVRALRDVSVAVPHETFTAVMGPSGSGKSTLLHVAAGLDRPTDGRVSIGATEVSGLSATRLTELRRDRIGFVFQAFNLFPRSRSSRTSPSRCGLPGIAPTHARSMTCLPGLG